MSKPTEQEASAAVGAAGSAGDAGKKSDLGKRIEEAMSAAVLKAMEDGVSDPNEQRQRMLDARESVLKGD